MKKRIKQHHNPWKSAFVILVSIIIIGFGFVVVIGKHPTSKDLSTNNNLQQRIGTSFGLTLNKQQLNSILAYYIDQYEPNNKLKYTFTIGNNDVILTGQTRLLGNVSNFYLALTPNLVNNSNIELKANKFVVGSLTMPVSMILSYIYRSYEVPKWIKINLLKKTITLNLTHVSTNGISYRVTKINMLGAGHFNFTVLVPRYKS